MQVIPPAENHRLLRIIGWALTLFGVLISAVNVLDGLGLRPGGLVLTCTGLGTLLMVQWGRNAWAVHGMCWGFLVMNILSALFIRGLANVSWIAAPIAIMAAAWFLGRRVAWWLAAVSTMAAVAIYGLQKQGHVFAQDVPLETLLAALLIAFAVAALIGGAISETYGRQFDLISESRAELLAVMDSTRAMIWSVDAPDGRLRTYNRVFEQAMLALGTEIKPGLLPGEVFPDPSQAQRWAQAYDKAISGDAVAWEERGFGNGLFFEVSCQPIRKENHIMGVAVYAQARHSAL